MKRVMYGWMAVFLVIVLYPSGSALAQKAAPQVPITYAGDTNETINRRAQWIEGAKKEGAVVWWGSDQPNQIKTLADDFNKIYPFINISFWRGSAKERGIKLEAEHAVGRPTADMCDAGEFTNYPRWREMGLVDKYTDFIPGIKTMNKRMYSRYGDWAAFGNIAATPWYNTKLVPAAEAPKSWDDLLDPKWKGKIGLTSEITKWYVLALGEGGWGVEKTDSFLRKLKQQEPIWAPGHTAAHNWLIAGEFKIVGENNLQYMFTFKDKKPPVDWCRVSPVPVTGGTFLLAKKAPHPNAARLFIEWLFSPQGLALYEKMTGHGAAASGSGTQLSKALEGLPLVYRTEDVALKAGELNLVDRFAKILGVTPE